jgi:2-succinyl-5-enolpyruvyl-6-hydroxy-3-cyclohexene-1-carboxylate synthase
MAANLLTEWASLLLGSFRDAGIADVVISPGSRSTPFVVAAARCSGLRCHDSIDERGAAYFALGLARMTGRPSLLICTSGTAVAQYLPAVIEASLSYTPVVMLTADRPFELQDCGASQTIDQTKIFGEHAAGFFELGGADASLGSLRSVRRIAAQAVSRSQRPMPGAVHVNARAKKPLDPVEAKTDEERALHDSVARLLAGPIASMPAPKVSLDGAAASAVAASIERTARGVIVAGPAPLSQRSARAALFRLAQKSCFPILCEAASQLRFAGERPAEVVFVDAFDQALRSTAFRRAARPDLILQVGSFPVSTGFERYCSEHADAANVVLAPHGWHDPINRATTHLIADVATAADQLADLIAARSRSSWTELFEAADREGLAAARAVAEGQGEALNEAGAARAMVRAAPNGSALLVGNSLAVRLIDTFADSTPKDLAVLSQRGAAGIDGLISGAAGAARASDRPLGLFIGDVSFFHDASGLSLARGIDHAPLVIAVVQNRGGRIFEQLPIATAGVEPHVLAHITTPHALEVEPTARGFGLRYARAESTSALDAALAQAYRTNGCTVIEAVVPEHEVTSLFHSVWARTDRALQGLG